MAQRKPGTVWRWSGTSVLIVLLVWVALATAESIAGAASQSSFKVLVFSKTAEYRHESIPHGVAAVQQLGALYNFAVDASEDAAVFTESNLAQYAAVIFLNTTGDVLHASQQAAFEWFIAQGGGFVGIHSAADTEYDWPWYGGLVGAYFASHPDIQQATIQVVDPLHPSTAGLPAQWVRTDEWYNFRPDTMGKIHVVAILDETTYAGGTMGAGHPIAWCQEYAGGRAWYTAGGHTPATYSEPLFRQHLRHGIEYAAGAIPGDCRTDHRTLK